jgi:hypothetical protein
MDLEEVGRGCGDWMELFRIWTWYHVYFIVIYAEMFFLIKYSDFCKMNFPKRNTAFERRYMSHNGKLDSADPTVLYLTLNDAHIRFHSLLKLYVLQLQINKSETTSNLRERFNPSSAFTFHLSQTNCWVALFYTL